MWKQHLVLSVKKPGFQTETGKNEIWSEPARVYLHWWNRDVKQRLGMHLQNCKWRFQICFCPAPLFWPILCFVLSLRAKEIFSWTWHQMDALLMELLRDFLSRRHFSNDRPRCKRATWLSYPACFDESWSFVNFLCLQWTFLRPVDMLRVTLFFCSFLLSFG